MKDEIGVRRPGQVAGTHLTPYVWYVILLLAMVNMVNYMDRMAFAMLAAEKALPFDLRVIVIQAGVQSPVTQT